MINIDKIMKNAIENNASDIHLVCDRKPSVRIARVLKELEDEEVLTETDMFEIYEYFIRGNIEKDAEYQRSKQIDFSLQYGDVRFRGNISSSDDIPVLTLRIIKIHFLALKN